MRPVLGPPPGERNEPADRRVAVETIAHIKGETVRAIAEAVYHNAFRLYGDCLG